MVRIQGFQCCGLGSIPGQGTEILPQHGIKKKKMNTSQSMYSYKASISPVP